MCMYTCRHDLSSVHPQIWNHEDTTAILYWQFFSKMLFYIGLQLIYNAILLVVLGVKHSDSVIHPCFFRFFSQIDY